MLAINLPPSVENRLFVVSQTIGISQDKLAETAISQYLANLDLDNLQNLYPFNNVANQTHSSTMTRKHAKSRAGALAKYANPNLIPQEKSAWANAMLDKHEIKQRKLGGLKGSVLYMADDFNEPLSDFKDYM